MFKNLLKISMLFATLFSSDYGTCGPGSINELLDHAELISPEIQIALGSLDVTKQTKLQASQIPNPEIGIGGWRGRASSLPWRQVDVTLTQPVELGGKRGSRIDIANSQIKKAKAEMASKVSEVRLNVLLILYRVRQILDEMKILQESNVTFTRLVNNYKNRPQLSPEQTATLFNFELALNDYTLKMEEAKAEYNQLQVDVRLLTGFGIEELKSILPQRKIEWPKIDSGKEANSPTMRIFLSQKEFAENELKLAKSEVWPTVNIGPSLTLQEQFGDKANILGVVVNFPIPVLNQNNGARAVATKNILFSKKLYQIEKTVLETRQESLVKTYLSSSKALASQAQYASLLKRHEKIEGYFFKGLISSPMVLESHRQMFDSQRLFHDREIKTVENYCQILLIQGGKIGEI